MEKQLKNTKINADSQKVIKFVEAEEILEKPYSVMQYFFTEFKQNPANKSDKHAATKAGEVWEKMSGEDKAPYVNYNLDGAY